jgi:hypothetical protein
MIMIFATTQNSQKKHLVPILLQLQYFGHAQ